MARAVGAVAGASLAIYLTHWQVFPPLAEALPVALAIPLTVGAGVAAWAALGRLTGAAPRAALARIRPRGGAGPLPERAG